MPTKTYDMIPRLPILTLLAGLAGALLLWRLLSIFPQTTTQVLVTTLIGIVIILLLCQLARSRRIELRTLVLFAPVGVAALCFPFSYVVENRQIIDRLERAGISSLQMEPRGRLAEALDACFALYFDYPGVAPFRTKLRSVNLNLGEIQEDALEHIPVDDLTKVWVYANQERLLTSGLITWLNDLPQECDLNLSLFYGLAGEDVVSIGNLQHAVHSLDVSDQILSENALRSILHLGPKELSFINVGMSRTGSLVGRPKIDVELLAIGKNSFSDADTIALLNTTNPKTLVLLKGLGTVKPQVFESVFSLQRLEGLSASVPWLTIQHLDSLGTSETLRWVSIQNCGITEEQLEQLRTEFATVRINGK